MSKAAAYSNERVIETPICDAIHGHVRWSAIKSIWFMSMTSGWIIGGSLYVSLEAVAVFFLLSAIILCLGHSLGMHRKLIHESFGPILTTCVIGRRDNPNAILFCLTRIQY